MEMIKMSMAEVKDYLREHSTAIIPIGAVEEHSRALPLGTDTLTAEAMSVELGNRTKRVVAPTISIGNCNSVTFTFSGTMSIPPVTLVNYIIDYLKSLYKDGFRRFLFVNGHGGNIAPLRCAIDTVVSDFENSRFSIGSWWLFEELKDLYDNAGHAGRGEASIMLYLYPELVNKNLFTEEKRSIPHYYVSNDLVQKEITITGIINDSQESSEELGKKLFERSVEIYKKLLEELER
jgi:creatinine amidohydrolase